MCILLLLKTDLKHEYPLQLSRMTKPMIQISCSHSSNYAEGVVHSYLMSIMGFKTPATRLLVQQTYQSNLKEIIKAPYNLMWVSLYWILFVSGIKQTAWRRPVFHCVWKAFKKGLSWYRIFSDKQTQLISWQNSYWAFIHSAVRRLPTKFRLEAPIFDVIIVKSLWNFTNISAALLRCL